MIFPSNRVRIMVATKPVDFRKGHDGLAALVKNELHKDPFTGTVFVFRSRKADRLKLIYCDGSGKAAMVAMSASMAKAVAAEGVTVNAVSPGTIRSEKLDRKFRAVAQQRGIAPDAPWEEVEAEVLPLFASVPIGRVGTVEEIADAVAFLASPRAAYITGSNLRLDGGMLPTI